MNEKKERSVHLGPTQPEMMITIGNITHKGIHSLSFSNDDITHDNRKDRWAESCGYGRSVWLSEKQKQTTQTRGTQQGTPNSPETSLYTLQTDKP